MRFKIKAPGFVGTIHDRTDDPYQYGEPDCAETEWRDVFVASNDKNEEFW